MTESEQRAAVIAEARTWIGTKFMQNQCLKGVAVDCGRFLTAVYGAVGVKVPQELPNWPKDWMMHVSSDQYLSIIEQFAHEVETPQPGDVVLFRFGRAYSHSGIVTDYPEMIHSGWRSGVQVGSAAETMFARRPKLFFSPWRAQMLSEETVEVRSVPRSDMQGGTETARFPVEQI